MVVVVFRSRLRDDVDIPALESAGARMYELATSMPGFISYKDFATDDGEFLSLVEFADEASVAAWGRHPEHVAVQERGRKEFMSAYNILVCVPIDELAFPGSRQDARVLGVFRSLRADASLLDAARELPGFHAHARFAAQDGEYAEIVEFADDEALPSLGASGFAPGYRAQICTPLREHTFQAS
jgi:heme-degrading monooxygenase HmoA